MELGLRLVVLALEGVDFLRHLRLKVARGRLWLHHVGVLLCDYAVLVRWGNVHS